MSEFNTDQRHAIEHGAGPLIIIAGPGSGKTTVITNRISYLVNKLRVNPENILVLTFSRAAAAEMQARYELLIKQKDAVTFGTIHSVFYHVLLKYYGSSAKDYIISEGIAGYHYDESVYGRDFIVDDVEGGVRFDEMLQLTYELLGAREDICEALRKQYKWILIDEFQDIDELQYKIVKMIAGRNPNLTIVGDDDQSIYGFRGARPDIMHGFTKDYPGAETIILRTNYRSTKSIVRASKKLIRHNKRRFSKRLKSANERGTKVVIKEFNNTREEYMDIAASIQGDSAVLFRTNMQNEYLTKAIEEYGRDPNTVTRMTFHASKGLEFDTVYIIDANEGIAPHKNSRTKKAIEEERRMFYVAMTRARKNLFIYYVKHIRQRPCKKSRFIAELK